MSKENFKETKITGEVLEDPEMLEQVMNMFSPMLAKYESKIAQLKATLAKEEMEMRALMDRFEILEKYKVFLDSKGFHVAKQTIDAHAAEIREAQKERISEGEICRNPCYIAGMQIECMQYRGHIGSCGLITS